MLAGLVVGAVLGVLLGACLGWALLARRQSGADAERRLLEHRLVDAQTAAGTLAEQLETRRRELAAAQADQARLAAELEHERRAAAERGAAWEEDRRQLTGAFAELSTQALQQNAEQFLTLADTRLKETQEAARGDLAQRQQAITALLAPLQETLTRYEVGLRQLELDRKGAYSGLTEQVKQLTTSQDQLQKETRNLVTALRSPQTRGRWGEMQLRRVVEMAGMVAHCDFDEQVSTESDDGRLRPDVVVHLPGGAQVVVDAKVPLDAFLRSAESDTDEERKVHLVAHARQLRTHVDQLAKREYWQQFDPSPEFVVAFIPGDPLLAAAFEHDPGLIEHAMASRVLLATPTTLIALLRTVAYGWQQEKLADNARQVQRLGAELYERLRVLGGHLTKVRRGLNTTVEAFNDAVGSLESRVLVTARRFPELGVVGHDAEELAHVEPLAASPRSLQAPELVGGELDADPVPDPLLPGVLSLYPNGADEAPAGGPLPWAEGGDSD